MYLPGSIVDSQLLWQINLILYLRSYWHTHNGKVLSSVSVWMGELISMSISVDSPSDVSLNRGPWRLILLRQQYEI